MGRVEHFSIFEKNSFFVRTIGILTILMEYTEIKNSLESKA